MNFNTRYAPRTEHQNAYRLNWFIMILPSSTEIGERNAKKSKTKKKQPSNITFLTFRYTLR